MKLQSILSVAFGALLCASSVSEVHPQGTDAQGPADPKSLIEEVLELSGAKKQISQIPAVVQDELVLRKTDLKPDDYAHLAQIITEAYRAEGLYEDVRDTFKARFDEQRLLAARQAFGSPLFRRMAELEDQASTPEALPRIEDFAAQLQSQPPAPDRVALIRRLDNANGVTELNVELMLATLRGIALAIGPTLPPDKRLTRGQVEQVLGHARAQVRTSLQKEVAVTLLYAYRSVGDGELTQYLAFSESDAGRWFTRVFSEAMLAAMTASADRAAVRMGKTLAPAPEHDSRKSWALATSAILTERNGQRHDLLGGSERTDASVREWKRIMSQWWGVNSRADLFQTLKWLEEGGHRQEFEQLGLLVESLSPAQQQELRTRAQQHQEAANRLWVVETYYRKLGPKSLLGWDMSRYISLCRWGYLVGYLSEEEAWERIMPAARALQGAFDSWKDLGENYLIGRVFWSLKQTEQSGQLHRDAYDKLLNDPRSPWQRYPWNTKLDN